MIERVEREIVREMDLEIQREMGKFFTALERVTTIGLLKIQHTLQQSGKSLEDEISREDFVAASMNRY